ncbi:hypothetical protein PV325_002069 [Microctonus aethiopoides]|nr:hypothetical protein PV325_002069 [Microctonus aethiopoides]
MRIKNYYNNRLRFMNHFIVMTFTLFGVVHSITSWLGHNYPIPIWIPHEINMIIPFWILFIYSSLSCWIHIMLIMSYDLMFSGHLTLLAMHLDILKYRFAIIPKLNKLNRKIYLTQCIQYQQYIYELSENVQDAFFTTNSACTFSVGISLCLGVFKLSVDNLYSLNTWACIQFILAVFVKWAIQCWEATIVMQKSIEIGDAAYNLNWIDFNKPTAITVMIIIRRSSVRPIIFYGILAIILSVNTLKTVGSVFY